MTTRPSLSEPPSGFQRDEEEASEAISHGRPGCSGAEGHTSDPKKLIKGQYPFGEVASSFQKEIRRGDVRAAMYWGHLLYGEAPYYAWKRALVTAAEDVGLAAPEVVEKVCGLALAWRICREKSYYVSPHGNNLPD